MATLKKTEIGFQDKLSLNAGQKYCRILQVEHSAILLTLIKLPVVIKAIVLYILERQFYTDFTLWQFLCHTLYQFETPISTPGPNMNTVISLS